MKKVLILPVMVLALCAQSALAQGKGPGIEDPAKTVSSDHRKNAKKEQAEAKKAQKPSGQSNQNETDKPAANSTASVTTLSETGNASAATTDAPVKTTPNVPVAGPSPSASPATAAPAATSLPPVSPKDVYRIGTGDVLDIRLLNASSRESTLYTVMSGGLLEYPLAGAPFQVSGLTTDEVKARLAASVKVYDNPQFVVSVREYMSHSIIVTGLVNNPGARVLRREAMPLYVVLAEAQPRADAARASIMRAGSQSITVDLSDSTATSMLVQPGDVIQVQAAPPALPQFYFIGGQINSPGQKDFHKGLTLTQAVLASGGISRFANSKVRVSRQGADGRLVTTEHNLKQIEEGKVPDPTLQAGDRIEVGRGHW